MAGQVSEAHVLRKPGQSLCCAGNFGTSTRAQAKLAGEFFWGWLEEDNLHVRRIVALGMKSWWMSTGEMARQLSSSFKIYRDWLRSSRERDTSSPQDEENMAMHTEHGAVH